jgi:hypothetical protein
MRRLRRAAAHVAAVVLVVMMAAAAAHHSPFVWGIGQATHPRPQESNECPNGCYTSAGCKVRGSAPRRRWLTSPP